MKKRYIALMVTVGVVGGALVGTIATFELQPPEVISRTVEAVTPPPERIEVTRNVMIRALEDKLEITTFSMYPDAYVVAGVCDGNWWQDFAYRNCVTMLVPGKVNAGFDWETFGPDQITTSRDEVIVHLGQAEIQDVVIDHKGIEVLGQEDGAFVFSDKKLQTKALAQATVELRQKACRNDILKAAGLSAEKKVGDNLRLLLKAAGDVRTVSIVYDTPTC
jgi:Protein of unknown function (DUF4230)